MDEEIQLCRLSYVRFPSGAGLEQTDEARARELVALRIRLTPLDDIQKRFVDSLWCIGSEHGWADIFCVINCPRGAQRVNVRVVFVECTGVLFLLLLLLLFALVVHMAEMMVGMVGMVGTCKSSRLMVGMVGMVG